MIILNAEISDVLWSRVLEQINVQQMPTAIGEAEETMDAQKTGQSSRTGSQSYAMPQGSRQKYGKTRKIATPQKRSMSPALCRIIPALKQKHACFLAQRTGNAQTGVIARKKASATEAALTRITAEQLQASLRKAKHAHTSRLPRCAPKWEAAFARQQMKIAMVQWWKRQIQHIAALEETAFQPRKERRYPQRHGLQSALAL
jgi:hypothetical protein